MGAVQHAGRCQFGAILLVAGMSFGLSAESVPGTPSDGVSSAQIDATLRYIVATNPNVPIERVQPYAAALHATSERFGLDHCLALAQAQVESTFFPDQRGAAGEIGLYQILPSTGAQFDREPDELRDPQVNTEVALEYLRQILTRKPALRDALAEYNGGPRNRSPYYALTVLETYMRVLRHRDLECAPERNPVFPAASHVVSTPVTRASYRR